MDHAIVLSAMTGLYHVCRFGKFGFKKDYPRIRMLNTESDPVGECNAESYADPKHCL